jgi:hypothetical protein
MTTFRGFWAVAALALAGCDSNVVDDEEAAQVSYLGLDRAVDRAIELGFDGFNDPAQSANIPAQDGVGDHQGQMVVDGKVDSGASNNKEMDLNVQLLTYSDGQIVGQEEDVIVVYDGTLALGMSMKGLPNADLTGSFGGTVMMSGALEGPVTLDLSFAGKTQDAGGGLIQREPGTTHISGTATSDYGVYPVDVTR